MDSVIESTPPQPEALPRRSRPSRRRIVELSTYPLYPARAGGQIRGLHLAKSLSEFPSTEVEVVSLTTRPDRAGTRQLGPHLTETCILLDDHHLEREAQLRLVTAPVAITDIAAGLMWSGIESLSEHLGRSLQTSSGVVLVQPYLIDLVEQLGHGQPIVCDEHNDELLLKRDIIPMNTAGRWLLGKVDQLERRAVESAALVTTTTEADLLSLEARYSLPADRAVVPNGVDTSEIEFVTGGDRRRRRLALRQELGRAAEEVLPTALFVGSGHRPNIEAGKHVLQLALQLPNVHFVLAGAHSESLRVGRRLRNVSLLGSISEDYLNLLLAGCDLALNPMDGGSGSNLKLLSYLTAGLPVVSTPVGSRGIDAEAAGVHSVGLELFAQTIEEILSHPEYDRSFTGRAYVEEHCDWRSIGRQFTSRSIEHFAG